MLEIDGSHEEGGGQLLRTSLSLSALLQEPFRINNIRANRPKPGLQAQHLTAVNAAAAVSRAAVEGNEIGSQSLSFAPRGVFPGDYSFDIPTAGSALLVLQTILPPLLFAPSPSRLSISGGTHVPWSPCFEYVEQVFAPAMKKMGAEFSLSLQRPGFYPAGGGKITAEINPAKPLNPFSLQARGSLKEISGVSVASSLPIAIAERQKTSALKQLARLPCQKSIEAKTLGSASPGTYVFLSAEYENIRAGFFSLGARGKPAEAVGKEAAEALLKFDSSSASVDAHLADQLLLYCALAGGESRFTAEQITPHLTSNVAVIKKFIPEAEISVDGNDIVVIGAGFK